MAAPRSALRLVELPSVESTDVVCFCSNCGTHHPQDAQLSRVCPDCHMGVVLEIAGDLAPNAGDAFLIADSSLNVGGVSEGAARWLGREEQHLVNRPVTELFEPAEVTKTAPKSLAGLMHAAVSASGVYRAMVRPTGMFGVHVRARFGQCAPSGLLIVLDVPRPRPQLSAV